MKAVQITVDDELIRRIDKVVTRNKRSWFFRRAAEGLLKTLESKRIQLAYRQGYAQGDPVQDEFAGWEDQGAWPAEK